MLSHHKEAFYKAADRLVCWIGLREPNPLAEKWIGRGGVPKGIDCKAKTSDNPSFKFSGLVVSPTLRPEAFKPDSLDTAEDKWCEFAPHDKLPSGYSCVTDGPEKGLVKKNGSPIFADYDLMAICKAGPDGRLARTTKHEEGALFIPIRRELNAAFGVPMIQHGAEFMWNKGVGAREREFVLWFGPKRQFRQDISSMPTTPDKWH